MAKYGEVWYTFLRLAVSMGSWSSLTEASSFTYWLFNGVVTLLINQPVGNRHLRFGQLAMAVLNKKHSF
jgi:hypothetical protein